MTTFARFDVVRKETKEEKLNAFILRRLARAAEGGLPGEMGCLMIARTSESPVVRALLALGREPHAPALRVCALLTGVAPGATSAAGPIELSLGDSCCRLSRDPRLLDAHELLVLGQSAVWIGDSMRRDPAQSDSYERYSDDCVETAARALTFFGRLWRASALPREDIEPGRTTGANVAAPAMRFVAPPLFRPVAPTRH